MPHNRRLPSNKYKTTCASNQLKSDDSSISPSLLNKIDTLSSNSISDDTVMALQRTIGNQATYHFLQEHSLNKRGSDKLIQRVSFEGTPWGDATDAVIKTSGHGGVVIVSFGEEKIIVKKGNPNEALGAGLTQEVGLKSPSTRIPKADEVSDIDRMLARFGVSVPNGKPYLVIEFVPGIDLGDINENDEVNLSKGQIEELAASVGQWLAYDLIIAENDRFTQLTHGFPGINSTNFRFNPDSETMEIIGIDQAVSSSELPHGGTAVSAIKEASPSFAGAIGQTVWKLTGKNREVDFEDLGDLIVESAKTQLLTIGQTLTPERVQALALELGVEAKIAEGLISRLEAYTS